MIGGEQLRRRVGELVRTRRASIANGAPITSDPASGELFPSWPERRTSWGSAALEACWPGTEWRDEGGAIYVHERSRSQIERRGEGWGCLEIPPESEPTLSALQARGLGCALFLDLETGGFGQSPVFLAGTMHWNGEDFTIRQYFARHYGEEPALLRALGREARRFDFLVTFNGKSYDVPFLRDRASRYRMSLQVPQGHLDLLHPARRRWRARLSDCRLQTLERHVCRRRRSGDVRGEEVPWLYHDFVRSRDPRRLLPVFRHNLLDILTLHDLLSALCRPEDRLATEAMAAR